MVRACLDTDFGGKKRFTKRFGTKPHIDDLLHGTLRQDDLKTSKKLSRLGGEDHETQLREFFKISA